ncbi:MAG: hypothetical protein OXC62_17380 [Aestuariivita sp.]|nr:hypothetical protein [Aestuariivita sp.]
MVPKGIHVALTDWKFSVLYDPDARQYDTLPSLLGEEAKEIYAILGWGATQPRALSKSARPSLGDRGADTEFL